MMRQRCRFVRSFEYRYSIEHSFDYAISQLRQPGRIFLTVPVFGIVVRFQFEQFASVDLKAIQKQTAEFRRRERLRQANHRGNLHRFELIPVPLIGTVKRQLD
jgi:hypothetical protein